jgi:hypothetical protein
MAALLEGRESRDGATVIEKKVLRKNCEKPVPAFVQSKSFAPCFRDSPPGAVCVEKLREVRLAASRGNRVQMKLTSTGFRAATVARVTTSPFRQFDLLFFILWTVRSSH